MSFQLLALTTITFRNVSQFIDWVPQIWVPVAFFEGGGAGRETVGLKQLRKVWSHKSIIMLKSITKLDKLLLTNKSVVVDMH